MKELAIIIPAYNEESAIASTIDRCIEVRPKILAETPVEEIEIIVVSDGSTDGTAQIARGFEPAIRVIAYEPNRGYGAALKAGFAATDADLVSFLDADGTCDPLSFIPMINRLFDEEADICIGSRMGPGSRMPRVRRIGNLIYRFLINHLGEADITDAASGMRVLRRASLPKLTPLPDGMDFTPSMSCRAVMDPDLKMVEWPMSYRERTGRSKLKVVKDGVRFLKTILNIAVAFRPSRFFSPIGVIVVLVGLAYGLPVVHNYLANRVIEEGMIYRIFAIIGFITLGSLFFGIGILMERVVRFVHPQSKPRSFFGRAADRLLTSKAWLAISLPFLAGTVLLTGRSFLQYVTTGSISQHWSQLAAGMLLGMLGAIFVAFGLMGQAIDVLYWQQLNMHREKKEPREPVRLRRDYQLQ